MTYRAYYEAVQAILARNDEGRIAAGQTYYSAADVVDHISDLPVPGYCIPPEAVLAELRVGEYVSGAEIARRLGISRQGVSKKVTALRRRGYCIEAAGRRGIRLVGLADGVVSS